MEPNHTSAAESRKKVLAGLLLVLAVAAAARTAYLLEFRHSPFFSYFSLDPLWHHQWAIELAMGDWAGKEVFFRAPLYPYLLGLTYLISDFSLTAPRVVQFAMGTISAGLVYLLGLRVFKRTTPSFIAGLGFALYGPMIYFEGELLIPALIVFLDLGGLLLFMVGREKNRPAWYAASGLVFGLSAIARPNVLAPALALLTLIVIQKDRPLKVRALKMGLPYLAALFLFPLLVTIRNGVVGGEYVFIASQGGVNFYIGNNHFADGKTATRPGLRVPGGSRYRDSVWLTSALEAEAEAGRKLTDSEVSDFWYAKSLKWMASDPLDAADLFGRKLFYLLHGHEIHSNNVPYFARNYSRLLSVLFWDRGLAFPAGIVIPLAIVGMFAAFSERKKWAPLYVFVIFYAGTIWLFFVTSRYRMPLVPLLLIFAVEGVYGTGALFSEQKWKLLALALAGLVALCAVSNLDALDIRDDDLTIPLAELGNYYYEQGNFNEAVRYYKEVLKLDPENHIAIGNLGTVAYIAGDYRAAESLLLKAINIEPENPGLYFNLGLALEKNGRLRESAAAFEKAHLLDPSYEKAAYNLKRIQAMLKKAGNSGP